MFTIKSTLDKGKAYWYFKWWLLFSLIGHGLITVELWINKIGTNEPVACHAICRVLCFSCFRSNAMDNKTKAICITHESCTSKQNEQEVNEQSRSKDNPLSPTPLDSIKTCHQKMIQFVSSCTNHDPPKLDNRSIKKIVGWNHWMKRMEAIKKKQSIITAAYWPMGPIVNNNTGGQGEKSCCGSKEKKERGKKDLVSYGRRREHVGWVAFIVFR